ncbi:hypothetical protein O1611_g1585 [Lasiodiplodia mahajangana]|uniref:Uncharacterized protein n=1 Tax=Lasiodiplodia mahajangana TaxID=1108764 RepID=A0ACC2JWY7_9PEZI|nr:hypothetical protein O1611_g1585 [Lasiodiplodia mahajangana]
MDGAAKKTPIKYGAEPNTIQYRGEDGTEHTIKLPQGPLPSAAPNNMEYEDGNGVKRSIYLPQGTMHAAWDHLENKRWDELAKFAPYTDQGYTDDDFKKARELKEKKYGD